MARAIDSIKRHYSENRMRSITVDEWQDDEGRPLVIYYEVLTVQAKDYLHRLNKKYGDTLEWLVSVLISEAKDAQAKPLFTKDEKPILMMQADAGVIERVATKILKVNSNPEIEKKN
jgi:hypothetical protein